MSEVHSILLEYITSRKSLKSFSLPQEFNDSDKVVELFSALQSSQSITTIEHVPLFSPSLLSDSAVLDKFVEVLDSAP